MSCLRTIWFSCMTTILSILPGLLSLDTSVHSSRPPAARRPPQVCSITMRLLQMSLGLAAAVTPPSVDRGERKQLDFADLGAIAFRGRGGAVLVHAAVGLMTLGVCTSYLVFVGTALGDRPRLENHLTVGDWLPTLFSRP